MGICQWLCPPPPPGKGVLNLRFNTPCQIEANNGDQFWTELPDNTIRMEYNLGTHLTFRAFQPGYDDLHFEHTFGVTNEELHLNPQVPDPPFSDWGSSTPEAQNVSSAILAELQDQWFEDAIIIRNDHVIWERGNIWVQQDNLASVCRFWLNLLWGAYSKQVFGNDISWLHRLVNTLPSAHAQTVPDHITVKAMLTYTTSGAYRYSDGEYWALQHRILEDLFGISVQDAMWQHVMQYLEGTTFGNNKTSDDGTNRVFGSLRDICRGARLLFHQGSWNDNPIISPEYVAISLAGGPNGDGIPEPREGYQTHLVKNQSAWEDDYDMVMTGVPDDCFMARSSKSYIIGIPSLNLIMAGHGPDLWEEFEMFQDLFLPTVVRACS